MRLSAELRERTKGHAVRMVRFYVALPKERTEVAVMGRQVLRSGTSVAAHAREASRARSDAEFAAKIGVLLQEADETALWLELLDETCGVTDSELLRETHELIAIFVTMLRKMGR